MKIIPAKKVHLPTVYEIETEAFGSHGYPSFFIRQAFDCWPNGLLIAEEKEDIAGYLLQVPSSDIDGDAWVLSVAVSKLARGRGVGKFLIEQAIENAKGYKRLLLTVCPKNKVAYALYESYGFQYLREEEDYFDIGEARHVLVLTLSE